MITGAYSNIVQINQNFIPYHNTQYINQKTTIQNSIVYIKYANNNGQKKTKSHSELTSVYNKGRYLSKSSKPMFRRQQMIKKSQETFYYVGIVV